MGNKIRCGSNPIPIGCAAAAGVSSESSSSLVGIRRNMRRALAIVAAVLLTSCVSYFLRGAKEYRGGPPPGAIASFTAKTCTTSAGKKLDGPTSTYYLANTTRGPAFYELDSNGQGSAITNYWRDAQGHHFAAYVRGRQAWEYVLPDDRSKPGVRKVFLQYEIEHVPGGFRISGEPTATCALVNTQAAASAAAGAPAATATAPAAPPPAPSPVAAPPVAQQGGTDGGVAPDAGPPASPAHPPAMLCVPGTTQTCVGSAGCHGGQYCLSNGSGYSRCDCGGKKK